MLERLRLVVERATDPCAWAVRGYHISHRLWLGGSRLGAELMRRAVRLATGVDIDPAADIGVGLQVHHGVGLVVGGETIGNHCILLQGVTIGARMIGPAHLAQYPTLGNRVTVCANACILGPVRIGDDAIIGAGAVVVRDVPAGATAVGNPARVLPVRDEASAAIP